MDRQQAAYFDALSRNRAQSAKALDGFALRGVRNSVVEKYSDQAHFIYELLQNADDAGATSARFVLDKDKLVFAHNGSRRFTVSDPNTEEQDQVNGVLGDINAITSVGGSNKIDEATIGKFGVGFKAVFQYTATPHIYEPNVAFRIERFIVPVRLETDFVGRKSGETLFVFPFDHNERSADDAFADISEKLRSLDFPLLFLSSLRDISFEVSGTVGLYGKVVVEAYTFDSTSAEFLRLSQNDGENRDDINEHTMWLFSRLDDYGRRYSVGFFVDADGQLAPGSHPAFCFFPTREGTGLNFILHAPFLLTDSREGIRAGVQHNVDLITQLSELAADSLLYLRDIGEKSGTPLIDDSILDIVPYDESRFNDIGDKNRISFKPIFTAMKASFSKESIIPSTDGYTTSASAYWVSVPQIAELFSTEQLCAITNNATAKWVFTSFGREDTRRKNVSLTDYIDSITRAWIDEDRILKRWWDKGLSYDVITRGFIEAQPIEWLHRFYAWVAATKSRTDLARTKPIFLDQHGRAAAAFDSDKQAILFLPREGTSEYRTINEVLLRNEETLAFIRQLGITEPSLRDEIYNVILPQYQDNVEIDTDPHFKKFFQHYQECSQTEAKSFLSLIKGHEFITYQSASDETHYRGEASDLYFPTEELRKWFHAVPETKFICFDEYLQLVGEDNEEELIRFFTDLGVKNVPRIFSRNLSPQEAHALESKWHRSTGGQSWTDKYIDGCNELIGTIVDGQSVELSAFVWSQLLELVKNGDISDGYRSRDKSVLYGRYDYFFYNRKSMPFESGEARRLRSQPWLANRDGGFVPANQLTLSTLHPQYDISSDEALELLKILRIGTAVSASENNDINVSSYAESLGFSDDKAKQILREAYEKELVAEYSVSDIGYEHGDKLGEDEPNISPSVGGILKEIIQRVTSAPKRERVQYRSDKIEDAPVDEDDYSKPSVDISKKIEKVKAAAEREIREVELLDELRQQALAAGKYSYAWFNALLELESLTSGEKNSGSREISIAFSKVEREQGTSRTLILKHPNRYIPQFMEDLADIPLELHFAHSPMIKVAVEVVNVKSYTLRAKLRTNAQIDDVDLSLVTEARIEAKNPVFLIEELRKAFIKLGNDNGYADDFNMQENLCENIEFVFGPPGTGKTTHLAQNVILPMMSETEDLKVLVLTPTNKAADVLVRRLMDSMDTDLRYLNWLVRFGATNDPTIEQSGVFRDKTFDIRTFPRNVTVTTIARFPYDYFLPDESTRLHLSALKWDYIVIDEASMIPLANIVYPLYKKSPRKFIVAGDPFQIEPITAVDLWKGENIYTMVKLHSFVDPATTPHQYHVELLTTQYRSIPEIGEVFSHFAYGGILEHFRPADTRRVLPVEEFIDLKPLNIIKFPVHKYESIYRPKRLMSKTPYHVYSALFAVEFVKYLSSLIERVVGHELFRIGLIAPYRAQADLIDKLTASLALPKCVDVQVGTIHGFQGDECDIVIALFNPPPSITTSKEMFLNKLNIVNVSISRARDYLFILMPDDNTENVDKLGLIKRVEHLCKRQPEWSEHKSPDIEDMIFGSKTYLEENSFSTSHQMVNVYGKPEKRYEVRSEDNAIDVQTHE